jgi:hypothetical protein
VLVKTRLEKLARDKLFTKTRKLWTKKFQNIGPRFRVTPEAGPMKNLHA